MAPPVHDGDGTAAPRDASGSGIPGSAAPGSIGPGIAVVAAGSPPFATSSSVGSFSVPAFSSGASANNLPVVPAFSSGASANNLPGASSPISLGVESQRDDRELAKHALKFIVAEIDSKIIESGTVGGTLLRRLTEEGLKYRVMANPLRGSILWKMEVPQIGQDPALVSEVPYILFVEEFCDLIGSGSFLDHVLTVRSHYPTFTVIYITNGLTNDINTCERSHYRNPSSFSWIHPPVEEDLSKIAAKYDGVHSKKCADEDEVAEHVVGLTSSLANCKFRKPLTCLSVDANGVTSPHIQGRLQEFRSPVRNVKWGPKFQILHISMDEVSDSYPQCPAKVRPCNLEEVSYHELASERIHGSQ